MASQALLFVCLFCRYLLVKNFLATCKLTLKLNKENKIHK